MKKKRHILLAALLLLAMAVPSRAQIFVMDESANFRPTGEDEAVLANPQFGQGYDSFVPLGDGILLLATLGGAYLLREKSRPER